MPHALKPVRPCCAWQGLVTDIARGSREMSDTPVTILGQHFATNRELTTGAWQLPGLASPARATLLPGHVSTPVRPLASTVLQATTPRRPGRG